MPKATLVEADFIVEVPPVRTIPTQQLGPQKIRLSLNVEKELGSFRMETLVSRAFSMYQASINFNHHAVVKSGKQSANHVGLAMINHGTSRARFGSTNFEVTAGQAVFTVNPDQEERHLFYRDQPTAVTFLEIDADYFKEYFLNALSGAHQMEVLAQQIQRNEFIAQSASMTTLHRRIIADINACPLDGTLGNMMLEGYIQQIMALQFSQMVSQSTPATLNTRDREIIHAVKDHLHQNFRHDHTLIGLARHFGINQNKLKKCFKQEIGVPVIEYLFNIRMDHARSMIFDAGMTVAEAATYIGYRHPHHFATAFKRRFGVSPSLLKA